MIGRTRHRGSSMAGRFDVALAPEPSHSGLSIANWVRGSGDTRCRPPSGSLIIRHGPKALDQHLGQHAYLTRGMLSWGADDEDTCFRHWIPRHDPHQLTSPHMGLDDPIGKAGNAQS